MPERHLRVAVVGAGIAGLTAAHRLSQRPAVDVVLYEASARVGGKIRTAEFAGRPVELGADAFLARGREVVALAEELGLSGELTAPAATRARLWVRGRLRLLPAGLGLGVPARPLALAAGGILSIAGTLRAGLDLVLPATPVGPDTSVAELIERRFGREVLEHLVDPLLGGVYAGDPRRLGLAESMPDLYAAARRGSLLRSAARPPRARGPVFHSFADGLETLPRALAAALPEGSLRLGAAVRAVHPAAGGLEVVEGGGREAFDRVLLAAPAHAAAELLEAVHPPAAARLREVAYASVASVLLAYPRSALPAELGSGFLSPAREGRLVSGCTLVHEKWPRSGGPAVVRCSVGRFGDERWRSLDEDALVAEVRRELRAAVGVTAEPEAVAVARWPRSLPQYRPGHGALVAAIEESLRALPGLRVTGAAYRGIGIAACVAQAEAAARELAG